MIQFTHVSRIDRLPLRAYHWPLIGLGVTPRGVVVIAHGAAEHAARYDRFAAALNRAGYGVTALDHRGHGQSPTADGHGDFGKGGWNALVADIASFIATSRSLHGAVPLTLFGHSMGAAAAQHLCLDHSHAIDALILSGSTSVAHRLQREAAAAERGETAQVGLQRSGFEERTPFDWLSRDQSEVDKYIADPWCGFAFTEHARSSMADRNRLADTNQLKRIRGDLPVLLVAGDADPVNDSLQGLRALQHEWHGAGVEHIDTQYYGGGRHEMLNEVNRDEVVANIIEWLGNNASPSK